MTRRHVLLFVAALAIWGCSNQSAAGPELKSLTVDEVAARIAAHDGKTFIFDDNPKKSWVKGHVPGAKWLDQDSVTAADLPTDKTATLIFYCHNES